MTTIYHNPRCSKSRQTLALLEEQNIECAVVEYLNDPPTAETLAEICRQLGKRPIEIIRLKDRRSLGLPETEADAEVIAQIVANPKILERPIVVHGDRARIGRPPENVLEIL